MDFQLKKEIIDSVEKENQLKQISKELVVYVDKNEKISEAKKNELKTPSDKTKLVKEVIPILKEIQNNITRSEYIKIVASALNVEEAALLQEVGFSNPSVFKGFTQVSTTNVTKSSNIKDMVEGKKSQSTSFEFSNIAEIVKAMKNFKFNSNGFEYEGRLFKEGDTLGNIKIDTFVPNSYIEFREINTNGSRAVTIKQ